jgi:hypothetical protein
MNRRFSEQNRGFFVKLAWKLALAKPTGKQADNATTVSATKLTKAANEFNPKTQNKNAFESTEVCSYRRNWLWRPTVIVLNRSWVIDEPLVETVVVDIDNSSSAQEKWFCLRDDTPRV